MQTGGEKIKLLKKCNLFSGLEEDQLDELSGISRIAEYEAGDGIFNAGDPAAGLFFLVSGSVKIYRLSIDGREQILHIIRPGEPFGEVAVFHGGTFPAGAEATARSIVISISRQDFIDAIARHPALSLGMLATLSLRLRSFADLVEDLSLKEVSARLAKHILDLSVRAGGTDRVVTEGCRKELAARLGTAGETLSRTLSRMKEQSIITVKGCRQINIINRRRLEELAAGEKL
ncbi:MAG: Crp/Fnr family transcriptional regulator [bacterium]|nr:Crp/Fnr family transcriptional regulator [bacterium]